jgi:hypothetical protein
MNRPLLLTACLLFLLPSCGKKESAGGKAPKRLSEVKEEEKSTLPPGHPSVAQQPATTVHSSKVTKVNKPVNIPEEVEKTWKFAVLAIVEKGTGKELLTKKVAKGDVLNYQGLEIKINHIVPHLVLGDAFTSASNEPKNPAVLVQAKEKGKLIYEGPIYMKFPEWYNINHPKYELRLKEILKK